MTLRSARELAGRIDHAVLQADVTGEDVRLAAEGCAELGARGLVVAPFHVRTAAAALRGTGVKVVAVVGFPLGSTTIHAKQFEALECEKHGAEELDLVINVGAIKAGDAAYVEREIAEVMRRTPECTHKVIVETGYLAARELLLAVAAVNRTRPRYIKTCTGFGPRGATVADVELIRSSLDGGILVKASAGIRTLDEALALLGAGASVLGTSRTAALVEELSRRIAEG